MLGGGGAGLGGLQERGTPSAGRALPACTPSPYPRARRTGEAWPAAEPVAGPGAVRRGRGRRRWAPRDEGCVSRPARLGSRAGSDDVGGASHRPASFCEASMPAAAAAGSRVVMSHGTRSVSRA